MSVTASSIAEAREYLNQLQLTWHHDSEDSLFRIVESIDEISHPVIKRIDHESMSMHGVWFPVFNLSEIIYSFAQLTARFRNCDDFRTLRNQLSQNNIEPERTLLIEIRSDDLLILANRQNELLFVEVAKNDSSIAWIRETERLKTDEEPWESQQAIINGDLATRFHTELAKYHDPEFRG